MAKRIDLILIVIFTLTSGFVHSQAISYPINIHDGQTIETCSGFFADSGGDTLTTYAPNEEYSLSFTNDQTNENNDYIRLTFLFFDLGEGDNIYIYDGLDSTADLIIQATADELHGEQIWSSGSSLHIRFESSPNEQGLGWMAQVDCFNICDAFVGSVTTETGSFDFCPEIQSVNFMAEADYIGGEPSDFNNNLNFSWFFEGDIKQGPNVSHNYDGPGAYPFTLTISDVVNSCETSITKTIRLATIPNFNATIPTTDTVCAREAFSLIGNANEVTWTGFPTRVDTLALITDTQIFRSQLHFDVFEDDFQILTMEDFDRVCINIEHVDFGHLNFELECPNGSSVVLKEDGFGGAHLGEPVVFRDDIPGLGYEYCFHIAPQFGTMAETAFQFHEYLDQAGNYYYNQSYLPAGTYTPVESFESLVGCPLNGTWSVVVEDVITGSSGYVSGWSLFFDDRFYPDSLIFTPEITEEQWFENGVPLEGNPAVVTKEEEGSYDFVFRVTDDFGCQWDTTLTVVVLPLPKAEIVSELEIPVCEGDSTLFTLEPLDDSPFNWVYQWMLEGTELESRIYDTLMAKEPANYMIRVTDTITGCSDFFDLQLSTMNCDLEIPNVFTPNADGINDLFEITNLEHYPGSQMVIYNRNGRKVFEHNDYYGNWWDGSNQPNGTYYYILTYVRQGQRRQMQGIITLLR